MRRDGHLLKGWIHSIGVIRRKGVGLRAECTLLMGRQGRLLAMMLDVLTSERIKQCATGLLITMSVLWSLMAWSQVSGTAATDCNEDMMVTQSEALPIHLYHDITRGIVNVRLNAPPTPNNTYGFGVDIDNNGDVDIWLFADVATGWSWLSNTAWESLSGVVRSRFSANALQVESDVLMSRLIVIVTFDRARGIVSVSNNIPIGQPVNTFAADNVEGSCNCCVLVATDITANAISAYQAQCPPDYNGDGIPDIPPDKDWDGDGRKDWTIGVLPGPNGDTVTVVCLNKPAPSFGYYYNDHNGPDGWVGKCPYWGGVNSADWENIDNDPCLEFVVRVRDGGDDDDSDGKLDEMIYIYDPCDGTHTAKHKENGQCKHYKKHNGPHQDFGSVEFWI